MWIEILFEEYQELYKKEKPNLSVYSSGTCMAGGYIGERYYPEDFIATTWGFALKDLFYLKSLKDNGEWKYWKWVEEAAKKEELKCANPNAPIVPCVICGKLVYTCECKVPKDGVDYLCPVHPDGCELHGGGWVCSDKCWEEAVRRAER